jgi:8-oxo-dGTP pyrophosphatase MutT (NUDIX family)
MHREPLLRLLAAHRPLGRTEQGHLDKTLNFVRAHPNCFQRGLGIGHITGSAWIVSPDRTQILLTHHQKLKRWLQPGGHADGNPDVLAVARQEAQEETGLAGLKLLSSEIFDVDVHLIPARLQEPAHDHYDIRFIFEADPDEGLVVSPESKALAWVPLARLGQLDLDTSLTRMVKKTKKRF